MMTVHGQFGFYEALCAISDSEVVPPGSVGAIQNDLHELITAGAPDPIVGLARRASVAVLRLEWAMRRADAGAIGQIRAELNQLRADWYDQTDDGVFDRFTNFSEPAEWKAPGAADHHLPTQRGENVRIFSLS